jgi:hypothetical protein
VNLTVSLEILMVLGYNPVMIDIKLIAGYKLKNKCLYPILDEEKDL